MYGALAVTTKSLAAQQDPEKKTLANGRRSSFSQFYSTRSQCSTKTLNQCVYKIQKFLMKFKLVWY